MDAAEAFEQELSQAERALMNDLDSPIKIQAFLDTIDYSTEEIYRCPLRVLRDRVGHCFDGALFAATALVRIGEPPMILELLPNGRDDDHILTLFKVDGHWGAIAKSNFVGLRYREPVYRTLRELAMSYFEVYFNAAGEKTLTGYTHALKLKKFDPLPWMIEDELIDMIADALDDVPREALITPAMAARLSLVDERSYKAGMAGADVKGLFKL